jgi:hypothetical protein
LNEQVVKLKQENDELEKENARLQVNLQVSNRLVTQKQRENIATHQYHRDMLHAKQPYPQYSNAHSPQYRSYQSRWHPADQRANAAPVQASSYWAPRATFSRTQPRHAAYWNRAIQTAGFYNVIIAA